MTYYDRVTQMTKNPNWHHWDYYKCHSGSNFDYIFAHPQSFISETFIYAKKHMLTSSVVGDKYQFNTPDISCPRAAHSISSFFLGFSVLDSLGVSERKINDLLLDMRADDYAALSTVISDKHD